MLMAVTLVSVLIRASDEEPFSGRYRESYADSHATRQEQFSQIQRYLQSLVAESAQRRAEHFKPDYSGITAYECSVESLRKALCARIGFPPPKPTQGAVVRWAQVAVDEYSTVYRMWLEVLEGVEVYGMFAVPKNLTQPAPLLICQHGGGGSPEVIAAFEGPGNYGWMVQRAVREGYVVWAPGLIFRHGGTEEIEGPERLEMDKTLRYVGTSILAVELWKIQRGLDEVLTRPEVDSTRVGMMGLSYGGLYVLFAAALDSRIKVAVSSCYFNDRLRYPWDDWSFTNCFNEFTDPEVWGLICPRALMIEVGIKDELFAVEGARSQVAAAQAHWDKLGLGERFAYVEFDGGHEFRGDTAYEFVRRFIGGASP